MNNMQRVAGGRGEMGRVHMQEIWVHGEHVDTIHTQVIWGTWRGYTHAGKW